MKNKVILAGIIILAVASFVSAGDGCFESVECGANPVNNCDVFQDSVFEPGVYNLPDGIDICASDIILDFNGAVFQGDGLDESAGINLVGYNGLTLKNAELHGYDYGLFAALSNDNLIRDNSFFDNGDGIYFQSARYNLIKDNLFSGNVDGIHSYFDSGSVFSGNDFINNGDGIFFYYSSLNSVNGNSFSGGTNGIYMANSNSNTIFESSFSNLSRGIYLTTSSVENVMENNDFINNEDYGIRFSSSSNSNFVLANLFSGNGNGILVSASDFNELSDNEFDGDEYGVYLVSANSNIVRANKILNSLVYGMYLANSVDNEVYDNYFSNQRNIRGADGNLWNVLRTKGRNVLGGWFLGGNFWGNPEGTGFSQTCMDRNLDGFCDEPFQIFGTIEYDELPLSKVHLKTAVPVKK